MGIVGLVSGFLGAVGGWTGKGKISRAGSGHNWKFICSFLVVFLAVGAVHSFAQGTRTLDGVQFQVITPVDFNFNADTGRLQVGQRYVIDGQVMSVSGATLMLRDAGAMNTFRLNAPLRLGFGANVTVFAEITRVTSFGVEARVVRIEGPGVAAAQIPRSTANRTFDGAQFRVITPEEYSFDADTGRLQVGQRYVIDGQVMSVSGATLMVRNAGAMNTFILSAPLNLGFGANVSVYAEVTRVTSFGAEARVVRVVSR